MRHSCKRIGCLLAVILLLVTLVPHLRLQVGALEADMRGSVEVSIQGTCGENVYWTLSNGVLTITGTGPMEEYTHITYKERPWVEWINSIHTVQISEGVTSVSAFAFYKCTNLTRITIPEGVTKIGACAFEECNRLGNVDIPDSVTEIGVRAFLHCKAMTEITVPEGVTKLGQYTFYECINLTRITLPKSLTEVGIYTFTGCKNLTEITFHENFIFMNQLALASCSKLKTVTFLGPAPEIAEWVFSGNTSTVYYPCGDETWTDEVKQNYSGLITWKSFHRYVEGICTGCGDNKNPFSGSCGENIWWRLDDAGTLTILGTGPMPDYSIPDEGGAPNTPWYPQRRFINRVVIASGVTTVGENALHGCTGVTEVTIPESVTAIGKLAFYDCSGLTDITIPESVTTIGSAAFRHCTNLRSVTLPENVTAIGKIAFFDCTGLEQVTIPGNVTDIGDYAFGNCTGLKQVTIPERVTAIGQYAFANCTAMTTVTFLGTAPAIGTNCFQNVTATAVYPCNDKTWTADVQQPYSGTVTWKANHRYENEICSVCGSGKPALSGDVDRNGKRTLADVAKLLAYIRGKVLLDADSLVCADVNGDGSVNIADIARLYAHVRGKNLLS